MAVLAADPQAGALSLRQNLDMPGACLPSTLGFDATGRLWAAGLVRGSQGEAVPVLGCWSAPSTNAESQQVRRSSMQ